MNQAKQQQIKKNIKYNNNTNSNREKAQNKQAKQNKQDKQINYANRITILTLIAYVIGLLWLVSIQWMVAGIVVLVISIMVFANKLQLFYQQPIMLVKFVITTFIFGIIHAFTLLRLIDFFTNTNDIINNQSNDMLNTLNTLQINQASQYIITNPPIQWPLLEVYLSFMCVYYYFQFQLNNNFHHHQLNWKSFLIYHSKPYLIAQTFCLVEHFVTKYLFHFQYKNSHWLIYPSLVFMILGEGLRICAFFTAKSNFTHLVRYRKHESHQLITHGIYSFFRHPSYTGYFYFAVSSQLFFGNWISAIGFIIVLIKFFNQRIYDQQIMLSSFFNQYLSYRRKTYILIPFVKQPEYNQIIKYIFRNGRSNSNIYQEEDDQ